MERRESVSAAIDWLENADGDDETDTHRVSCPTCSANLLTQDGAGKALGYHWQAISNPHKRGQVKGLTAKDGKGNDRLVAIPAGEVARYKLCRPRMRRRARRRMQDREREACPVRTAASR